PITETFRQTHLLNGAGFSILLLLFNLFIPNCKTGAFDFTFLFALHVLMSWLIVGINIFYK
ncbi:MAG: hypothetical protein ACOYOV_15040, partial [Bacteroidales bacterium]